MDSVQESLTRKTGRALRWNYFGFVTKLILTVGTSTLLARILGPKPFGELAIAMIVFGFGTLISNVGLTAALIQKDRLEDADIRFCFTCQLSIGLILTFLLYSSAPFWARFFHNSELLVLLRAFSALFTLQAFGTTPTALLNRHQDARTIQSITIASYAIAYLCIGVPAALLGAGVWSLVAAWLTQALLNSTFAYAKVRHSLRPILHSDHLPLLSFGARVLGANICSWGIGNLDNAIVGRFAGPIALGLYSRAFALLSNTTDGITSALMQVLFPAFSRVQDQPEKLRRGYAASFGAIMLVLLPALSAIAATPDVVMIGLYGGKWASAVPLLRPLALAIALNPALGLCGPLLTARGKPQVELRAQLVSVLVAVAVYMTAIHWSVLALSWAVIPVYLFRLTILTNAVHREIGSCWGDLFSTAWPALVLSVFSALVSKGFAILAQPLPAALRLVSVAIGTAIVVLACLTVFAPQLLRPILDRSPQLLNLIPPRIQVFVSSSRTPCRAK